MELDEHQRDNLANCDDRVPVHVASSDYCVQRLMDDPAYLSDVITFDAPLLGDLAGCAVAHLQCHIGTDSVSLSRLGADVTGLDFSTPAVEAARNLAERAGSSATFVVGNVYDAPALLGATFDVVYTSVGTIGWLSDLDRWAAAAAGLLTPGGRFYLRDLHPMFGVFEEVDGQIVPRHEYRTPQAEPLTFDEQSTYVAGDTSGMTHTRTHEWNHPLSDVVNALVAAGLTVDRVAEHDGLQWAGLPSMVAEGAQWFLPPPWRGKVPTMFSVWARRV